MEALLSKRFANVRGQIGLIYPYFFLTRTFQMVYQYPQLWFTLLSVTPSIVDGRKEKGNNRITYYQVDFENDKYLSFLPLLVSDGKSSESNITVRLYIFCLQSPVKYSLAKMHFHVFITCATTLLQFYPLQWPKLTWSIAWDTRENVQVMEAWVGACQVTIAR